MLAKRDMKRASSLQQILGAMIAFALCFVCVSYGEAQHSKTAQRVAWNPDNGDGTYKNPVIFADYSDPDVIRVGDDFYLTASSFNCAPGLPILHSKDLVNWRILAHVFQRQHPTEVFCKPQHGNGVWAPAIRKHNGEFFIFYGDPDFGIYRTKTRNAGGPWSAPQLIHAAKGWIDPCPFWDEDGKAYLVRAWARSRSGIQSILTLHRMSADGTSLLDEGKTIFDGHAKHPTIEGPKLYKRNGYYYIFAPAGGVTRGWQTVLRSKTIDGPYEDRIVMEQGKTEINGPHQGAWVELKSGEAWFMHFQDRGAYGRVVHLQPMRWVDDWPVIGADADGDGKGEPVLVHKMPDVGRQFASVAPQTSDEFGRITLGLQWQWHANNEPKWFSLSSRPGWLRLAALSIPENAENLWSVPNLLLQKFPAPAFVVTTRFNFSSLEQKEQAGLIVMGTDYSYIALERTPSGTRIKRVVCTDAPSSAREVVQASASLEGKEAFLRVSVDASAICRFSFSHDQKVFEPLGEAFVAKPGRWIGAKVGLFAVAQGRGGRSGFAEFDWFRVE